MKVNAEGETIEVTWNEETLIATAKEWEVEPDLDCAQSLYVYADIGHIQSRYGFGYWQMCPAYYARFNKTDTITYANIALDAASWIENGNPAWALNGETPVHAMSELILFCLQYWKMEKMDAKIKALENAKSNININPKR